jgi:phosphohistidine swiveling domain-containing protein
MRKCFAPTNPIIEMNTVTITDWNDSLKGDFLWSSANFGEAMPSVMTPFTWSLLQRGALAGWLRFQGFPTFGNLGGRFYFNVSVVASLMSLAGKNRQQMLEALESTMHTRLPTEMDIPLIPAPRSVIFPVVFQYIRSQIQQRRDLRGLPALLATIPAFCAAIQRRIQETQNKSTLLKLWQDELWLRTRRVWSGVLSSVNHYADLSAALYQKLSQLVSPDDAYTLISNLSRDGNPLASLELARGVSKIVKGELSRQSFLEQHGHRGAEEFEITASRLAEDPAWLDRQLAAYAVDPVDVEDLLIRQRSAFEAARRRLAERYPKQVRVLDKQISTLGQRGRLREASRAELARLTWAVKRWAYRTGGLTGIEDQVVFLTVAETLALLTGDESALAYIPSRKQMYENLRVLPTYPPIIRGAFDPFLWAADPHRRSDVYDAHASLPTPTGGTSEAISAPRLIRGAPGSAGSVEGRVRRLDNPGEGDRLLPGEILVTTLTNIGWTPLFPRLAAVITDVGAPLSHAAIVARELGIPAVVGCGNATAYLHTGDRVRVDGGRGLVEILDECAP